MKTLMRRGRREGMDMLERGDDLGSDERLGG